MAIRERWTTLILHTTSYIYRQKQVLPTVHAIPAFVTVLTLIGAELFLGIISLPLYVAADSVDRNEKGVSNYRIRRVVTLTLVSVLALIWVMKLTGIVFLSVYSDEGRFTIRQIAQTRDLERTLITALAVAEVGQDIPAPVISGASAHAAVALITGTAPPNSALVALIERNTEHTETERLKLYSGRADANGRFLIVEDTSMFRLAPGTYRTQIVAYDEARELKSAPSNAVTFTVHQPLAERLFGRIDQALNILALLFIIAAIGVTILTA